MAKSNFIIRGGADFSGINKSLLNTQKRIGSFQSTISKSMKLVTVALGSIAVGSLVKETTKMAMGVESSMDNINRNMQGASDGFTEWVSNQAKGWGIAKKDAYSYGSTFSNLLGSFQNSSQETANSTLDLMKASGIIASKTGKTYDDVANRIRSGMLGSTEAIEDLGIYTNISMIESTEAFKKFANGKSWSQLDFKVQQQIRLAAILEQTYSRYGDTLAETTQTKQARFLASIENIKLNLGQAFLPIYNVVLPALTTLGNMLEGLTSKLSSVSQAFFGKAISVQASAVEVSTDTMTEYGDAIETAGKQANKAIAPFDKLNVVSTGNKDNDKSSGIKTPTLGGGNQGIDNIVVTDSQTGFTKWLGELKTKAEPSITALKNLGEALNPLKTFVFDNLKNFYEQVLKPIGTWILGEGLPKLLNVCSELLAKIGWKDLTNSLKNLYTALTPFAISIGDGLVLFISTMAEIMQPVIATTTKALGKAINVLAEAINAIPESTTIAVGGAIGGLVAAILLFNGATAIKSTIDGIKKGMKGLLTTITAHPVVTIAAGVAALAGAVLALNEYKFNNSELGLYIQSVEELITKNKTFNEETKTMLEQQAQRKSDIEAEYGAIGILADKYYELSTKQNLSNGEQVLLKAYADELIEKIPELSGLIEEQTGAYKGTKDQLDELITTTKEYYLVEAAKESLIEIAKKQYQAEKELKDILDEKNTIDDKISEKEKEVEELRKLGLGTTRQITAQEKKRATQVMKLYGEIGKLKDAGEALDIQLKETEDVQASLNKEWTYAETYVKNYTKTAQTDIPKIKDVVKTTYDAISKDIKDWKLPDLVAAVKVDSSALTDYYKSQTGSNVVDFATNKFAQVKAYATGGHPVTGDLFIANDDGPELVGKMGNKTTVANQQQITDGIEEASYRGMIRAIKDSGGFKANVEIAANSRGIFDVVRTESKDYKIRTGKQPF